MRAGKLRSRIAVYRSILAPDGAGGQGRAWGQLDDYGEPIPLFFRRVSVRPVGGVQVDVGSVLTDQQSLRITMRRSDILTGDRVVRKGKNYRVRSVAESDDNPREIVILVDLEVPE